MKIASCPRIIAVSALLAISAVTSASELVRFWIGANQAGIYAGEIDVANGKINNLRPVVTGIDAYYIVKHPDKPILYAVIRTEGPSKIRSYRITESGDLELESELNDRPHGASHINISRNGRYLGVAYYRTGIAGVYNLTENGKIDSIFDEVRHEGTSINRERQEAPHPHWAGFSDDSLFMYVPDLGTDHIWVYKLDEEQRLLRLLQKAEAPPGSGPRHMAIHPKLDIAYVSDELKARVSRYQLDRKTGKLNYLDSKAPAPEAVEELEHTVSDIRIHPGGRFLYLVNRGFDRVSVFSIDNKSGVLTPIEREPIRGTISRNIAFDPSGQWALVAGRDSNTLALFRIDLSSGKLQYSGQIQNVPTPMAIAIDMPQ